MSPLLVSLLVLFLSGCVACLLCAIGKPGPRERRVNGPRGDRRRPMLAAAALMLLGCGTADAGPLARLHAKRHPAATAGCTSCHSQPQATFTQTGTLTLPAIQCPPCPLPAVALPPLPTCKPCETCPPCKPAIPEGQMRQFESWSPVAPQFPAPMPTVRQPGVLSTITQAACPNGKCPLKK